MADTEEFDDVVAKLRDTVEGKLRTNDEFNQLVAIAAKGEGLSRRVHLSVDEICSEPELRRGLASSPMVYLAAIEQIARDVASSITSLSAKDLQFIHVGVLGDVDRLIMSPRGLMSHMIGRFVRVDGIVTKVSAVKPKVVQSTHYCPATGAFSSQTYRDITAIEDPAKIASGMAYRTKDSEGNILETEYGLSTYRDYQTVMLQEAPETAPLGQLPRSVEIIVYDDLVDSCRPGDRIRVGGVYRALISAAGGSTNGRSRTVILGNTVEIIGNEVGRFELTKEDMRDFRELQKEPRLFDILAASLAPSVCGLDFIKKALVLQYLGGRERNLQNGTHIRGDINILLVGDPSTAKSQLLRTAAKLSPLAILTTGRGSSAVGLTAAVTTDTETKERHLEAGAMVLADRGIVCIDEFDKMSDADRVAIHEVMEQQTVTIAKAGIHTTLNARCSVLAAANPVYGQYDRQQTPQKNVTLPDSLLSRFDLLFLVLDELDEKKDKMIADHVIELHRFEVPGYSGIPFPTHTTRDLDEEKIASETKGMWETSIPSAKSHGGSKARVLTVDFLRKYFRFVKQRYNPELTDESREFISNKYAEIRKKQEARTMPITVRTLETMIRLSTAHAKSRMSQVVEEKDCKVAVQLLEFALYHNTTTTIEDDISAPVAAEKASRKRSRADIEEDEEESEPQQPVTKTPKGKAPSNSSPQLSRSVKRQKISDEAAESSVVITDARYESFSQYMARAIKESHSESLPKDHLITSVNRFAVDEGSAPFADQEIKAILERLQKENKVMVTNDAVFVI